MRASVVGRGSLGSAVGQSRGGRSGGGAGANRQGDAGAGGEIAHILRLIRSQTLSTR